MYLWGPFLGPITNMGLNAKEVVRVFACSTQLAYNLSLEKYNLRLEPVKAATLGVGKQLEEIKDAFRYLLLYWIECFGFVTSTLRQIQNLTYILASYSYGKLFSGCLINHRIYHKAGLPSDVKKWSYIRRLPLLCRSAYARRWNTLA